MACECYYSVSFPRNLSDVLQGGRGTEPSGPIEEGGGRGSLNYMLCNNRAAGHVLVVKTTQDQTKRVEVQDPDQDHKYLRIIIITENSKGLRHSLRIHRKSLFAWHCHSDILHSVAHV